MSATRDPFRLLPWGGVLALTWLVLFPLTSVDVYYHLAVGKRILEERSIPDRGVGSATFGNAPWHDNEWGFQVIAALLGRSERGPEGVWTLTPAGRASLILWRGSCLAATLAMLSAHMSLRGVGPLSRAVGIVLAAFLTFGNLFWEVRPQMLSYVAFAAVLWLVERDRMGDRRALPLALLVFALWSNVHGAFLVGIAALGAEALGEALQAAGRGGGDRRRAIRLAGITALAPLAACLNPHGVRQVLHPFLYLLHPEIHRGNAEWTRPDFLHLPLLAAVVTLGVVGLAARRRWDWRDAVRGIVFVGLLTTAIRHLPFTAIALTPLVVAALAEAARNGGWRARLEPTGPGAGGPRPRLLWAAALVAAIVLLSGARFIGPLPRFSERPVQPMPERAARLIASRVGGNGFNSYRFGGFLMFRLYPQERVFMDGRNDLYGTFRHEVYNRIRLAGPGWRALWDDAVRRYDLGWILLDRSDPLVGALEGDPAWLWDESGRAPRVDGTEGPEEVVLIVRNTAAHRASRHAIVAPVSRP